MIYPEITVRALRINSQLFRPAHTRMHTLLTVTLLVSSFCRRPFVYQRALLQAPWTHQLRCTAAAAKRCTSVAHISPHQNLDNNI